uniref:Uncharacterized protein n=1 Tax=Meloidogyne javanica TaxID=6303 RepID=A0A915M7R4_MELJA
MAWFIIATWTTVYFVVSTKIEKNALRLK